MRAARIHDYDRPDGLSIDEVAVPGIRPDQLLVRVAAASVNPVDWKVRDGLLQAGIPLELPAIPGGDMAGTVTAIGGAVEGFALGDLVHGMTDTLHRYACGAFAEYVAVNATNLAPKPSKLDFVGAAAVPLAALTAWQALHDVGGIASGQRVLIHAAAGGVGAFSVQFARLAGAHVVGTASAANFDFVMSLGADQVIDYRAGSFEDAVNDVDLVIDLIGGEVQLRSLKVMRRGSVLVNAWGALAEREAADAGMIARKVAVVPNGGQLRRIGTLIEAGDVTVEVAHLFSLEAIDEAFALSRTGHGRGKIVIDMS